MKKGKLIIFEGGEGAGKGACIDFLKNSLTEIDSVIFTHEPGGTPEGVGLRKKLMQEKMTPEEEMGLFFEDRRLHFEKVITPAIKSGKNVICDRSFPSSYAYQITARERPDLEKLFMQLCEKVLLDEHDNLIAQTEIIYLDVIPEEGLRRKSSSKDGICTKFDKEDLEFHHNVRRGFYEAFQKLEGIFFDKLYEINTEALGEEGTKKTALKTVLKIIS